MRSEPKNRISPKAVVVWRISASLISFMMLIIFIAASIFIWKFNWPKWIIFILAAVWLLYTICSIFFFPKIRLKVWRYEVHEQELDLQHGLFSVKRVLVPMVRVQHVDTTQGPLLRKYHLATVTISTAATVHEIPALEMEEADQLRDYISKLVREAKEDV